MSDKPELSHAAGCIVVSFRWGQGYGEEWTLDVAFWMGDMGAVPLILADTGAAKNK